MSASSSYSTFVHHKAIYLSYLPLTPSPWLIMALSDPEVMPDEGTQVQGIDIVTLGMFIIGE